MAARIAEFARRRPGALLEAFALGNFAFLVLDVYLAHSVNSFRHAVEWAPVAFSVVATALLGAAMPSWLRGDRNPAARFVGLVVGYASVALGVAGVVYHLESQFFAQWTLSSLVYTAPFAAPLAYSGIGFLLVLNRMVPPGSAEWRQWVVFFACGGFVGVFVLALCDHAQNGFFFASEWWPVASSAAAAGALALALADPRRPSLRIALGVLAFQAVTGLAGFWLHFTAAIGGLSSSLFENFVHGAPTFAPLLFVDLAVLAAIGIVGASDP